MRRRWVLILLSVGMLLVLRGSVPAQPVPTLDSVCRDWGDLVQAHYYYRPLRMTGTTEDPVALEGLGRWDMSTSNWIGYANGGWQHHPGRTVGQVSGMTADWQPEDPWGEGARLILVHESPTTDQYVVFVFTNLTPYADANGEHFGTHPCFAALMNRADVAAWFEMIAEN